MKNLLKAVSAAAILTLSATPAFAQNTCYGLTTKTLGSATAAVGDTLSPAYVKAGLEDPSNGGAAKAASLIATNINPALPAECWPHTAANVKAYAGLVNPSEPASKPIPTATTSAPAGGGKMLDAEISELRNQNGGNTAAFDAKVARAEAAARSAEAHRAAAEAQLHQARRSSLSQAAVNAAVGKLQGAEKRLVQANSMVAKMTTLRDQAAASATKATNEANAAAASATTAANASMNASASETAAAKSAAAAEASASKRTGWTWWDWLVAILALLALLLGLPGVSAYRRKQPDAPDLSGYATKEQYNLMEGRLDTVESRYEHSVRKIVDGDKQTLLPAKIKSLPVDRNFDYYVLVDGSVEKFVGQVLEHNPGGDAIVKLDMLPKSVPAKSLFKELAAYIEKGGALPSQKAATA